MPIQPEEALDALRDIQRVEKDSAVAYRYQKAAPHLFLWGVIWVLLYGVDYVRPELSGWIGVPLIAAGVIGSTWLRLRAQSGNSARDLGWRYAATALAIFLFFYAFFAIFPPASGAQAGALFPLLVAICYVLRGVWTNTYRMVALGLVVGMLDVGAYLWSPHYFFLWMAAAGGGALILGGFWLRKV